MEEMTDSPLSGMKLITKLSKLKYVPKTAVSDGLICKVKRMRKTKGRSRLE